MHTRVIEKIVARIQCGHMFGTAFLISPEILLTALHTIDQYFSNETEIFVEFLNLGEEKIVKKVTPITGRDFGVDVVVLKLEEPLDDDIPFIKIANSQIPYNIEWSTFGYPVEFPSGGKLEGRVLRVNEFFNSYSWNIEVSHTSTIENCAGLSGAPLLIDGAIRGIFIYQANQVIGAIGINKFTNLLDRVGIRYENSFGTDHLPDGLEERAAESIPNYKAFELIENAIKAKNKGYVIVTGSPGVGKTLVSATFKPISENLEVVGRYFLRIPEDSISIAYRASSLVFTKWMENQFARVLFGTIAEDKEYNYHTCIERISQGLMQLSAHMVAAGKIGVIFIDGIDDAVRSGVAEVQKLLGLLPQTLPKNIIVVLSAKPELIPAEILQTVSCEYKISVPPLPIETCRSLISKHLNSLNLPYEQINSLAEKTSGHPLYINYVVKFLADKGLEFIDEYINALPVFSGEIESYYEKIWNEVCTNESEIWIVSVVCRLRNEIDKSSLIKMLPEQTAYAFSAVFDKIRHLIKDADKIAIFHFSFAEFVIAKTACQSVAIHDLINEFCCSNTDHEYSLRNIIYHLSRGSNDTLCVSTCTQEWADKCSLNFIEPDVIVSDIKIALAKAMEKGMLEDTVRLLLLLQRIVFRNNNLLAEFASEIAKVLIMIGSPDKALKFILRESMLLVSPTDALYFLHELYHSGAINEANMLYEAIKTRVYHVFEKEEVTIDLLRLHVQTAVLYDVYNEFNVRYIARLYHTIDGILKDSNYSSEREQIMNQLVAFQIGYMLWNFGKYLPLKEIKKGGHYLSKSLSELLACAVTEYKQLESLHWKYKNQSSIIPLIDDLEKVIVEYGTDNKRLAAFALYENSSNYELVERLIHESDLHEDIISVREKNGVDINWGGIIRYLSESKLKGYITQELTELNYERDQWELHLISIAKYISYSYGRACRLRAEGKITELNELVEQVMEKMKGWLTFSLAERVEWDRSYGIPENFIPIIYEEFTMFILEFDATKCVGIVQYVQEYSKAQLGLYTEGYREALFKIAEAILKSKEHFRKSFPILKQLEEHIDVGVLNRWERTNDLLKMSELYGVLGNLDKAKSIFCKMLETSMGPSWYKEDQLSIMADSLICLGNKLPEGDHLAKIAGLLYAADGEMTFQRYIRTEKENLLGAMFKFGYYDKALKYFRELTVPNLGDLITRAQSFDIDSPKLGDGYINGTREINEQGAILCMLEHCGNLDVFIKWALTEIFFLGDSRYNQQFITHQINLLNVLSELGEDQKEIHDLMVLRVIRMIVCDFDEELRIEYLSEIKKILNSQSYLVISEAIIKLGFPLPDEIVEACDKVQNIEKNAKKVDVGTEGDKDENDENDRIFFPGTFGTRKSIRTSEQLLEQAKSELEIENYDEVKKILVSALHTVQDGGWNIWTRPSASTNECFELLANNVDDEKQLLQLLAPLVSKEVYAEDWIMVLKLLKLTERFLSNKQSQACMAESIKHIELIVRPKQEAFSQFEWLSNRDSENEELEELIINFIVWLTDYPDRLIREKTIEVLNWLAEVQMEKVAPCLIKASLADCMGNSSEIAAGILHRMSIKKINCWKYIYGYKEKILRSPSFQIKSIYYEITKQLSSLEKDVDSFNHQLKLVLFSSKRDRIVHEVVELPTFMFPINKVIDKIMNTKVLNKEVFTRTREAIPLITGGLNIEGVKLAEKYIDRSYYRETSLLSSVVRKAFVRSLEDHITGPEYQKISEATRIYNPFFPSADLSIDRIDNVNEAIRRLFSREKEWADRCSSLNNWAYLHYFEVIYDQEDKKVELFEIITYFVNRDEFSKNPRWSINYESFDATSVPKLDQSYDLSASSLPAVLKVSVSNGLCGGDLTPAFPHSFLFHLGLKDKDFRRKSWRIGRDLSAERFGMPKRSGCSLSAEKTLLNSNSQYKPVHLVRYNENTILIDPEQNKVFGGGNI